MNPTTPTMPSAARTAHAAGECHGDGLRNQIAQALVDEVLSGDDAGERHTGQRLDAQLAERSLQGGLQLWFVARRAARDEMHRRREPSTFAKAPVDKSGSGSRICGRSVVNCDVAKSALTPTIVNSSSRLSSSVTVTRSPIGSVLRKQLLGERFGNHRDRRGHDAVLGRDRSTSQQRRADGLEKVLADARDVRRDELRAIRGATRKSR